MPGARSSSTPITEAQRRTLVAAALGWMLDAFDTMLYALLLAYIMRDLGMSKALGGLLGTLTLLASGLGGVLFGFLADRLGRKRALMLSILTYSLCSFASGLANSIGMLAAFRFILGLGMGAERESPAKSVDHQLFGNQFVVGHPKSERVHTMTILLEHLLKGLNARFRPRNTCGKTGELRFLDTHCGMAPFLSSLCVLVQPAQKSPPLGPFPVNTQCRWELRSERR